MYMPCTEYNDFVPELPRKTPDLIYLCFPNNPTGAAITRAQLQEWVDFANRTGAVILYDAAYEAYISEGDVPHSIYEIRGALECAVEFRSFSKNAGFTGVRLGFTVIPKTLKCGDVAVRDLWARRHGTKFNGAPYIVQKAAMAVYSEEGKIQLKDQTAYYMNNARVICEGLKSAGYEVYGGTPWLFSHHTVFGQILSGYDVLDAVAGVETDDNAKPLTPVVIESIEVLLYQTE